MYYTMRTRLQRKREINEWPGSPKLFYDYQNKAMAPPKNAHKCQIDLVFNFHEIVCSTKQDYTYRCCYFATDSSGDSCYYFVIDSLEDSLILSYYIILFQFIMHMEYFSSAECLEYIGSSLFPSPTVLLILSSLRVSDPCTIDTSDLKAKAFGILS